MLRGDDFYQAIADEINKDTNLIGYKNMTSSEVAIRINEVRGFQTYDPNGTNTTLATKIEAAKIVPNKDPFNGALLEQGDVEQACKKHGITLA